jgi:FADH2 O2-dependent halogenase
MHADVAVLGAGFAGSLTALLLARIGLQPALIDRASHPRFAIGESSTPSANLILRDLCINFDLPRIAPLAKYGTWKRTHPGIVCGPKRGFSYFQHHPHQNFEPGSDHALELLVAASSSLETSDTHWLRADVDGFLAAEVQAAGIPYFDKTSVAISRCSQGYRLEGSREGEPVEIDADFLIDATGEAGVVLDALGVSRRQTSFVTNSRALFGHFINVTPWRNHLLTVGGKVEDHPFDCDQSALHQVLEEGWMWQLRFDNGITSAGFALRGDGVRQDRHASPLEEWSRMLDRYPAVAAQFGSARLVAPPHGLCRTGRLQRCARQAAGENWAALPHTAGFVDPLHSTGIAHSLCGIERLIGILRVHWGRSTLSAALQQYERTVRGEIEFIDELVGSCYATLGCFEAFIPCSMLYFAAATTFERRRLQGLLPPGAAFLCADDDSLRAVVSRARRDASQLVADPTPSRIAEFRHWIATEIAPFNHVGLLNPNVRNMYRHTAIPVD